MKWKNQHIEVSLERVKKLIFVPLAFLDIFFKDINILLT